MKAIIKFFAVVSIFVLSFSHSSYSFTKGEFTASSQSISFAGLQKLDGLTYVEVVQDGIVYIYVYDGVRLIDVYAED